MSVRPRVNILYTKWCLRTPLLIDKFWSSLHKEDTQIHHTGGEWPLDFIGKEKEKDQKPKKDKKKR